MSSEEAKLVRVLRYLLVSEGSLTWLFLSWSWVWFFTPDFLACSFLLWWLIEFLLFERLILILLLSSASSWESRFPSFLIPLFLVIISCLAIKISETSIKAFPLAAISLCSKLLLISRFSISLSSLTKKWIKRNLPFLDSLSWENFFWSDSNSFEGISRTSVGSSLISSK